MNWTDVDGAHTLYLAKGAIVIQAYLKHEPGIKGWKVKVNNRSIQPLIADLDQAKQAGLVFARKILSEASKEIDAELAALGHHDAHSPTS